MVSNCRFVTFPIGMLGQVWYLIVSIPDLCILTYLVPWDLLGRFQSFKAIQRVSIKKYAFFVTYSKSKEGKTQESINQVPHLTRRTKKKRENIKHERASGQPFPSR